MKTADPVEGSQLQFVRNKEKVRSMLIEIRSSQKTHSCGRSVRFLEISSVLDAAVDF